MLNHSKFKLLVLTASCLCASQVFAGNWMRNEGDISYSGNFKYATSNKYWDQQGVTRAKGCNNDSESFYNSLEYGYSYRYTLLAGIGLDNANCPGQGNAFGLGDLSLGIRGRIDPAMNGKAWEIKAIIPTGYSNTVPLRLGYGRFGVQAGVYFGDQFEDYNIDPYKPGNTFIEEGSWQYGAYVTAWEGPPANQLGGYVKWGKTVSEGWKVSGTLEADLSLGHGQTEPATALVPWARQPFHDVLIGKVELARALGDGWTISLVPETNLWGRNISQSTGIFVGLHKLCGN